MSLIQRTTQPIHRGAPVFRWVAIGCFGIALFLLNIGFGAPPSTALDASWTEVMAWAALKHAQWGHDIVFTYGPLGFLHGAASYVPGIFDRFVIGQILLNAAFTLLAILMLRRRGIPIFILFAVAYAGSYPYIPSDIAWEMTLLFGTAILLHCDTRRMSIASIVSVVAAALLFGIIALIKFSIFPLWLLCVIALVADSWVRVSRQRALSLLVIFPVTLLVIWSLCGQGLNNLPAYLHTSFAIASGYGHTMGSGAPITAELTGVACLGLFGAVCLFAAYSAKRDGSALIALALYAMAAFLGWRAGFTRGDRAPGFFAFISLLPFAMLSHRCLANTNLVRGGLTLLVLVSATVGLYGPNGISQRWSQLHAGLDSHFHLLMNLPELKAQKNMQWAAAKKRASLPKISRQIGAATVDMFTYEQGVILLNGLNYAPRPVFQSYSAYTPYLARLNEAYFLGPQAPEYVLMKLAAIDGRLPMLEDPLALAVLLQRYRPVLMEHRYLLLERAATIVPPAPITSPAAWVDATLGKDIPVAASPDNATIAFVKLKLSLLGQAYSFLLREPTLRIAIQTDDGSYNFRFVRPTGASGFMLSPLITDTLDWAPLQLGTPLPHVRSFRIQPETAWQSIFFQHKFDVGFETRDYLRLSPADTPAELVASFYPGFNLMPTQVHGISDLIVEDGKDAMFLHAPGTLQFAPQPAHYRISGEFGIRSAALTTPACSPADGIGMSLVLTHDNADSQLLHLELDPFHKPGDRGAHPFRIDDVDVAAGDSIEYRIDPGHGGGNTACDWSYVRDMKFMKVANDSPP